MADRKKRLETGGVGGTRRCGMCRWLISACACTDSRHDTKPGMCVWSVISTLALALVQRD